MAETHEALLRAAYAAFNRRDIDGALKLMHPDVDWPNAWEGGRVRGRAAVGEYWSRQFEQIDSRVEPESFNAREDGRVLVGVHQVVRDREGELVADQRVGHLYSVRDGLVERMDVIEFA